MNIIYGIVNVINRKVYIGSTTRPRRRFIEHRKELRHDIHSNRYLQNSYNKHGCECFHYHTLESDIPFGLLEDRERYWVRYLNSDNRNYGYNITKADYINRAFIISDETRDRMGRKGEAHHYYGKHRSKETRRKISEAQIGRKPSEETRAKLSKAKIGKTPWNKGIPCPEDVKKKISASEKGKKASKETIERMIAAQRKRRKYDIDNGIPHPSYKVVEQLDMVSGEVITTYPSMVEANRQTGASSISECCAGHRNHSGGYKWRLV